MLLELYVENYILIDKLHIPFSEGLNVLTGETGAGKSILLGALGLILGDKFNKDTIKSGCEKAIIQGTFVPGNGARSYMQEIGADTDDDLVILSRELYPSGRSVLRVNGRIFPKAIASALGEYLVDIHGQNEHQVLLRQDSQRKILDQYGGPDLRTCLDQISGHYQTIQTLEKRLNDFEMDGQELQRRIEMVEYQLNEIEAAQLKPEEDEQLESQLKYLKNYEQIHQVMTRVQSALHDDSGLMDQVSALIRDVQSIESFDSGLGTIRAGLEDAFYTMENLAESTRDYSGDEGYNPQQLSELEERYNLIESLKRKYGRTIQDVLAYKGDLEAEAQELSAYHQTVEGIRDNIRIAMEQYDNVADNLSELRRHAARKFKVALMEQLKDLNMKDAAFEVDVQRTSERKESGIDQVVFKIASNPGQPLRDMRKVVSGGELSRIMLAVKLLLGQPEDAHTLIFDEVDAGISGITAAAVGDRLRAIAAAHQVICITHLPQIAVVGQHHLEIRKEIADGITTTTVGVLNKEERVQEIGRLIGDGTMSDTTRAHAEELLRTAGHM